MSIKLKRFITLSFSDTDSWGYNEDTLPMLVNLVDASSPDHRTFSHTGVIANYLTSAKTLKVVQETITRAENLRHSDPRFTTLGIGLAEGELVAELDWLGSLKTQQGSLIGDSVTDACRVGREPQRYQEVLLALRQSICGSAA